MKHQMILVAFSAKLPCTIGVELVHMNNPTNVACNYISPCLAKPKLYYMEQHDNVRCSSGYKNVIIIEVWLIN
jgi:hypothetical protein